MVVPVFLMKGDINCANWLTYVGIILIEELFPNFPTLETPDL